MDTNDLRKASMAVFLATDEAVAKDLSNKLKWAADEIDRLYKHIAILTAPSTRTARSRAKKDKCNICGKPAHNTTCIY